MRALLLTSHFWHPPSFYHTKSSLVLSHKILPLFIPQNPPSFYPTKSSLFLSHKILPLFIPQNPSSFYPTKTLPFLHHKTILWGKKGRVFVKTLPLFILLSSQNLHSASLKQNTLDISCICFDGFDGDFFEIHRVLHQGSGFSGCKYVLMFQQYLSWKQFFLFLFVAFF